MPLQFFHKTYPSAVVVLRPKSLFCEELQRIQYHQVLRSTHRTNHQSYDDQLLSSLSIGDEHVTHEYDHCMGDKHIEIPALDLFHQFQVLFCHFKQNLYIPVFTVDPDYFGIEKLNIGG